MTQARFKASLCLTWTLTHTVEARRERDREETRQSRMCERENTIFSSDWFMFGYLFNIWLKKIEILGIYFPHTEEDFLAFTTLAHTLPPAPKCLMLVTKRHLHVTLFLPSFTLASQHACLVHWGAGSHRNVTLTWPKHWIGLTREIECHGNTGLAWTPQAEAKNFFCDLIFVVVVVHSIILTRMKSRHLLPLH